jgi:hypothetical protein
MKIIILILTAFLSFGASATRLPDMNRFGVNQTGNSAKIGAVGPSTGWGSEIPISPTPGGWAYAGNYGIPQAATGPTMNLGHSGDVFFSGTKYPFQAAYQVPGSTLVDAIGAIAGGPISVGLFALPFALQWLLDSGGRVTPSNTLEFLSPTANCSPWVAAVPAFPYPLSYQAAGWGKLPKNSTTENNTPIVNADCAWGYMVLADAGYVYQLRYGYTTVLAPDWLPISMQDIAPYMKQTPFDPRVIEEILDKGGDIPFPQPTITGPSEILGPKTETPNPDGSTTVTQPRSRFTISGDTITNTTNETTVTVINVDNSVRSSSTTVVTPTSSTGAPEPAEDPCIANPERLGCVKLGEPVDSDQLVKETVEVMVTPVDFSTAAACPGPISFNVAGHQYAVEYTPLCEKLAVLKYLFLAMAGFVAAYVVASMFKV